MAFVERAQEFLRTGSESHADLLYDCLLDGSLDALRAVQMLYEDMYGGMTYNFTLKAPAGYCLVRWGTDGLRALVEAAIRSPRSKNISIALGTLSALAAGQRRTPSSEFAEPRLIETVERLCPNWNTMPRDARTLLNHFLINFPDEGAAILAVGHQFTTSAIEHNMDRAREVFEASAARFIALGEPTLEAFAKLIATRADDESAFQSFLTDHPQLLDPMALEVWPQPSLWGAKEPDFLIRRSDDTYVVVEIECPSKLLLTGTGQLSADSSHAVQQALDYADKLIQRQELIASTFPNFRAPDCLVINGLEEPLTPEQKRMLVLENGHRRGVRIAGFDWLITRARSIADNFVGHRVRVLSARIT